MENQYIRSLLLPNTRKAQERRVWSIALETVWLPFFTATNTVGDSSIPIEALGAPLRLGYAKDGSVKFRENGSPVTVVAKPIRDAVALVRENFVAQLKAHAHEVATAMPDQYNSMVKLSIKAGKPILAHDRDELDKAIKLQLATAMTEAQTDADVADGMPEISGETEVPQERELAAAAAGICYLRLPLGQTY